MNDEEIKEKYYYELITDYIAEFWEISIKEYSYTKRYGQIGTKGERVERELPVHEAVLHLANKEREIKERHGYVLKDKPTDIKTIFLRKETDITKKSNFDRMEDFLMEKRAYLCDNESPHYGNFPDDLFDQSIEIFYEDITLNLDDPNKDLDKKISFALDEYLQEDLTQEKIIEMFPQEFLQKVNRWITIFLNEFFLRDYQESIAKLTTESLDKLVNGSSISLIGTVNPPIEWSIEDLISYFTPVIAWTERVSLSLLYTAIALDLSPSSYDKNNHYNNMIYWLDPNYYVSSEKINDDDFFLKIIPNILKTKPIPNKLFPKDLISKIKRFLEEYSPLNTEMFKSSSIYNSIFPVFNPKWADTLLNVFLYLSYYGFVNSRIHGIKHGAYTIKLLEEELNDLFNFMVK